MLRVKEKSGKQQNLNDFCIPKDLKIDTDFPSSAVESRKQWGD
jgi:hypothetical protein